MNNTQSIRVNYSALKPFTPYITAWSGEMTPPADVIADHTGVQYRDEIPTDRDRHGVLWYRSASQPGRGEPEFARVHSLRQRKAMNRLLCHICGGPPNHTEDGYLWLLPDHRDDWDDWPHGMGIAEPPVCAPCAHRSIALCPALRAHGTAVLRVRHAPITGVRGGLYAPTGDLFGTARLVDAITIAYTDHRIRWMRAHQQVRTIEECAILDLDEIRRLKLSEQVAKRENSVV